MTTRNIDLFNRIADTFEAGDVEWNQLVFGPVSRSAADEPCFTHGCVAGTACHLSGDRGVAGCDGWRVVVVPTGGKRYAWDRAKELLGITSREASVLFDYGWTPHKSGYATLGEALRAFAAGAPILLLDAEDRREDRP